VSDASREGVAIAGLFLKLSVFYGSQCFFAPTRIPPKCEGSWESREPFVPGAAGECSALAAAVLRNKIHRSTDGISRAS